MICMFNSCTIVELSRLSIQRAGTRHELERTGIHETQVCIVCLGQLVKSASIPEGLPDLHTLSWFPPNAFSSLSIDISCTNVRRQCVWIMYCGLHCIKFKMFDFGYYSKIWSQQSSQEQIKRQMVIKHPRCPTYLTITVQFIVSQLKLGKLDWCRRHTNKRSSLIWFAARGRFWMQSVLVLVYLPRLLSCLEAICKLYFFLPPPTAWQAQHYSLRTGYSIAGKITGFTWYSTKLTCFPFGGQDKAHLGLELVGHPHYSPVGPSPYQQSKTSRNSTLQLFSS